MTHSEENYLKAIYHLSQGGNRSVSTTALASQMNTQPSSVTDMVRKLADKKLVIYKKYRGVLLSEKGRKSALSIIRKHRLWEVFLAQKLGFSWDEVHEVAEQLEHIKSEKLIDKLEELLQYPKFDPHGDPIPSKDGSLEVREKTLLSQVEISEEGICVGVKDSSAAFLKFLDKHKIALGDHIKVEDKEEFDHSMHVRIGNRKLHLSQQIAGNLYVKLKH